jgi:predicted phage terminase large subunit-like protein
VLKTRLLSHEGRIVLINTRWSEDDVIGRLLDRTNDYYSAAEAKKWKQISLPALAKEDDVLGRKPGEALWPEKFPAHYLLELRDADPRGFQALYMSSPTPEKGNFFDGDRIRTYVRPTDRPPNDELRFYCASDHAVSTKQDRDKTVLLPVGIDADDNIWVLDDVFWKRAETDVVIEAMIDLMAKYRPQMWFAERGHISKSIGPFLRKRMVERGTYCTVEEIVPVMDKASRAQSIRGRISMGKVYLPSYAPWFMEMKDEILKFPYGAHDDVVDALAYVGLGLAIQHGASRPVKKEQGPKEYTFAWLKAQTRAQEKARSTRNGGW